MRTLTLQETRSVAAVPIVVVRQGYGSKSGGTRMRNRALRRRWFSLGDDGRLLYFQDNTCIVPLGFINLLDATLVDKDHKGEDDRNTVTIKARSRIWKIHFETATERIEWHGDIQSVIDIVNISTQPPLSGDSIYQYTRRDPSTIAAVPVALPVLVFCVVCTDPIRSFAVGECDHRNICSKCFIMEMTQYGRRACITCKANFGPVVVTENRTKLFREFDFEALRVSRNFENTYFDGRQQIKFFEDLYALACPKCNIKVSSKKDLMAHCRDEHKLNFCKVCWSKRKGVVPRQQRLYTLDGLREHRLRGDPATATEGPIAPHLTCKLCSENNIYDIEDRNMHMIEKHVCCQLCRRRGTEEWVANDKGLLAHYKDVHITCDDPKCCAAPMENVYDNQISFQAHQLKVHGDSTKSKLQQKSARRLDVFEFLTRPSDAAAAPAAAASAMPPSYQEISFDADPREQNRVLMNEIRKLKGDEGFFAFRQISGEFFKGQISAETYYDKFCEMFKGCPSTASIWTLLVSSLPNPTLRSELYGIHYENVQNGGGFNIGSRAGHANQQLGGSGTSNSNGAKKKSPPKPKSKVPSAGKGNARGGGEVLSVGNGESVASGVEAEGGAAFNADLAQMEIKNDNSDEELAIAIAMANGEDINNKAAGKKGRFKKKQVLYRL
jgi:hypothetical protein